jgi:trehalose 6-phosphate synthase/phosphatase
MSVNKIIKTDLAGKFINATLRLILLDYDGTLVTFKTDPAMAFPSGHVIRILKRLADMPSTDTVIISGRDYRSIDRLLGDLPVKIIAGHGAMIKENGEWKNLINDRCEWKDIILPLLDQMSQRCSETFIENKKYSLAWHYRNAASEEGYFYSRELITLAGKYADQYNLKILDGNKVVEIMDRDTGKGNALKKLLEKKSYDFILSIGDDTTDEEIFDLLLYNNNAYTIKVGEGKSSARYRFGSVRDVVSFLKYLSE